MTSLDKSEDLQSLRHIKLSAMIRNKQMIDQYILGPARTLEDQEIPLHPSSLTGSGWSDSNISCNKYIEI